MTPKSHDQNFKNLFLDFPKEALEWILPQSIEIWGPVQHVEFVRQEPKKRKLSDAHLALDMPILFSFRQHQLLLWLVEFQEDKAKFSIHKLLRYTVDLVEAYPKVVVVPTVLFTDRKTWRKDVLHQIDMTFKDRVFLHFEYVFVKLFDYNARDYYHVPNPIVKILLPKMNYVPEERWMVIWQAIIGLQQLVSLQLLEKYMDFIDIYAEVQEEERKVLQRVLQEHKEFGMLRELIIGEDGLRMLEKGREEGIAKGLQEANILLLGRQLTKKYNRSSEDIISLLEGLRSEDLLDLGEYMLDCESFDDIQRWVQQRRQGNLS